MDYSRSALQKLEDLGPRFRAQVRNFWVNVYQLSLDHSSQFDGWLRKLLGHISRLESISGCDVEDSEKILLLRIGLGPAFGRLRRYFHIHSDIAFGEAVEIVRSRCASSERNRFQSNCQRVFSSNQRSCYECGSVKHLARSCPVRLTMEKHFCRYCNRFVFHQTHEHKDFSTKRIYPSVSSAGASSVRFRNQSQSHQDGNAREPRIELYLGTSHHIISDSNLFVGEICPIRDQVLCNGQYLTSSGKGNIVFQNVQINNVRFIPDSCVNVLSVSELANQGCKVSFFRGGSEIRYQGHTVLSFSEFSGEYILDQMSQKDFIHEDAETGRFSDDFSGSDSESS